MKKLWNKDFVLLLQGSSVSMIGDLMYSVAIGYWVYEQTGSSSLMGIMSSISMFVTMFLSPFSGSIIDRCNRKWVLVLMDLMQAAIMLTIGLLAQLGQLNVPIVLIAAFLAALGSVFYSPALSTLMIDIIPRDDMVRGQSIFSGSSSLINMVGSAFSGVLVAFFGVPLIVIINGLSNLYSAISELFINVPKTVNQGSPISVGQVLSDTKAAVKTVFSNPCLKVFAPCALLLNLLCSGPTTLALPFLVEKGFDVKEYGYMMSTWTAASLLCVLLLGIIKLSPKARYLVMAISFTISGLAFVAAYMSTNFTFMCVMIFIGAFLNCAGNTVFSASMMLALPEENRSAILGFIQSACVGGSALSAVMYGFLGDIFPLYIVFVAGTLLSLCPMIYVCFHKDIRNFIIRDSIVTAEKQID